MNSLVEGEMRATARRFIVSMGDARSSRYRRGMEENEMRPSMGKSHPKREESVVARFDLTTTNTTAAHGDSLVPASEVEAVTGGEVVTGKRRPTQQRETSRECLGAGEDEAATTEKAITAARAAVPEMKRRWPALPREEKPLPERGQPREAANVRNRSIVRPRGR